MRNAARSPHTLSLLLLLALSWATVVHAEFSLTARPGTFQAKQPLTLLRNDLDTRSTTEVAHFEAASDGSLNRSFEANAGLYLLEHGESSPLTIFPKNGAEVLVATSEEGKLIAPQSKESVQVADYERFRKASLARLVYPARAAIAEARQAGAGPETIKRLTEAEVIAYQKHLAELNDFAIDEIGASLALYASSLRWTSDHRFEELKALVETLAKEAGEIPIVRSMSERIQRHARVAIGAEAPSLSGSDLKGDEHTLADLRGQITLVDFWASWCPPCRLEHKTYHEALKRYRAAGFSIFSINLDQNRQAWNRASQQDDIDWIQISDMEGWQSPLAARYNVSALPANFLLDRDGRIIAKNLRDDRLLETLQDLLGPR